MSEIFFLRPCNMSYLESVFRFECIIALCYKIALFALQVFGEGVDSVKKSLEGIFDDTVPDGKVRKTWTLQRSSINLFACLKIKHILAVLVR